MKTIVYQGIAGAFSHITAEMHFGPQHTFVGKQKFKELFEDVVSGAADYAVVPIENTLAGSVYENYDLLEAYDVHVIAEHKTRIEHHLMGLPGATIEGLTRVFSHPKALEQCETFFEKHPHIEEVIHHDTAGAAQYVQQTNNMSFAAIASSQAAQLYNLTILKQNIEDNPHNWTRFFIVSKNDESPQDANKVSIMFSVHDKPGSLFRAMKVIADNGLNMSKIQSRPIEGKPFEYFFYVDLEFPDKTLTEVKTTLTNLQMETGFLKTIGFYKKDTLA